MACVGGAVSSPEKAFCRIDCFSRGQFLLLLVIAFKRSATLGDLIQSRNYLSLLNQ